MILSNLGRIAPRDREAAFVMGCLKLFSIVIARHRVGATRGPMTGSGGRSGIPETFVEGIERPRRTGYPAFAGYDGQPKRKGLQLALEPLNGQGIAGYVPEP
jgi:hypothetical protein